MFFYKSVVSDQLAMNNLIDFNTDTYDVFNSEFLSKINELPESGRIKVTTEVGRPDLLSYSIYGTVSYWRYLLLYNNINFSSDILPNTIIKYFNIADLNYLLYQLKARRKDNEVIK